MDGRGGCCIARYAGGAYEMSKMDQIMLRFRPIAPKPATGAGSVSSGSTPGNSGVKTGRVKRKYVRDSSSSSSSNSSKSCNKKRKASPEETVVTLPLLPEKPEQKESTAMVSLTDHLDLTTKTTTPTQAPHRTPIWLNFNGSNMNNRLYDNRTVVMPNGGKIIGSCVTVECVTDTWMDANGLGCTDEKIMRNLEKDTCPGFISDGLNNVKWTNGAYRRMVGGGDEGGGGGEIVVWLVMKERLPLAYPAFTCRVRMQYTCNSGSKEKSSITLPCDVWRMDGGGFAWRLDVKAALCLGW